MYQPKNFQILVPILTVFLWGQVCLRSTPAQGQANGQDRKNASQRQRAEDPDLGRPISRTRGQGRSGCLNSPIALVPGLGKVDADEDCMEASAAQLAQTVHDTPTFWIYLPKYENPYIEGEFVLIDNRRQLKSWKIQLPEKASVVCFQMPYELEEDNIYSWQFEVKQNPRRPSKNPRAGGLIQRMTSLSEPSWSDQLTQIGWEQPSQLDSDERAQTWSELLAEQGLEAIASTPVLAQCSSPL